MESAASLAGRRAVVTGGTRGVGRAIVEALLSAGASVTFCGRTSKSTESALAEMRHPLLFGIAADVSVDDDVSNLFAFGATRMSGIDTVIANTGIGLFRPVSEMPYADWRSVINTNLTGAFSCTRHGLPHLAESGGNILYIGSLSAKSPFAGGAAYTASKAGLIALAESTFLENRHQGIRVTTILPGSIDTDFSPRPEAGATDWKIAPADVAEAVLTVLRMPARTTISTIEMRPTSPRK